MSAAPSYDRQPPKDGSARSLELYGLGARIVVGLTGPRTEELSTALQRAWSRCLTPSDQGHPEGAESLRVLLEGAPPDAGSSIASPADATDLRLVAGSRLDAVLQQTTQAITRGLIAAQTGRLLMFHAGACADPVSGATVAYVAPGGTGKTTLSRLLGRTLGYLTDETVAITHDGRVRPYPKPLSIRSDAADPKQEASPDDLGLLPAPNDPWLRRIVLLHRVTDHRGAPTIEELDLPGAIIALAPETSALSRLDHPLHLLSALLAGTGPVLRCTYREATDLIPVLTALVSAPAPAATTIPARAPTEDEVADVPPDGTAGPDLLVRVKPVDSLELDDGILILHERNVARLSELGGTIVGLCRIPRSETEIADHLVAAYGAPPDGSAQRATHDTIDALVTAGILRRTPTDVSG